MYLLIVMGVQNSTQSLHLSESKISDNHPGFNLDHVSKAALSQLISHDGLSKDRSAHIAFTEHEDLNDSGGACILLLLRCPGSGPAPQAEAVQTYELLHRGCKIVSCTLYQQRLRCWHVFPSPLPREWTRNKHCLLSTCCLLIDAWHGTTASYKATVMIAYEASGHDDMHAIS